MMSNRTIHWTTLLWAAAILIAGLALGAFLIWTGPTTAPEEKASPSRIVRTIFVQPQTARITVTAYGPVIPARTLTIKPQVSGRVIRFNDSLVPGGLIREAEELIAIDPSDYELDLAEQESALEQALFEKALEEGRQVVARREWGLLQNNLQSAKVNQSLVLREPHLRRTEAMVRSASNEIARAQLALSRTSVAAPFNAMVMDESVELGQLVEAGSGIATLVGTDEFWVQAALPVTDLIRIPLPDSGQPGASARVYLDSGGTEPVAWTGTVVRLLSDLETTGRMARMLIRVEDPLGLQDSKPGMPLLLGSYVRVEIDAGELEDILVIPRVALREGGRIWVVDQNNELQIRDARILWTRQETVLIPDIVASGEQLVISGLKTALPGMKVDPQPDGSTENEAPSSEPAESRTGEEMSVLTTP